MKKNSFPTVIQIAILVFGISVLGTVIVFLLINIGAKPKTINVGPVEFEIPTVASVSTGYPTNASSTTTATPPSFRTPTSASKERDFCPPIGSEEAMFAIPLEEMGMPVTRAVGSGIFERVVRPFGTRPTPYRYVKDAMKDYPCVQYITPSVLNDPNSTRQCIDSHYHTNRIWVGSVLANTSVLLQRKGNNSYKKIGSITIPAPDARSYLAEYEIYPGDKICIESPPGQVLAHIIQAGGYHLWIGRDLKIYTDSWCLMLENDDTMHWCQ